MKNKIKNHKSFTLIEVLLVSALFSMAGVMIYYSFANGLKLWQRAQVVQKEESIAIFFDRLSKDLRQTLYFSKIKFEGQENLLSFAGFVTTVADPESFRWDEGLIEQIGVVNYEFDALGKKVLRRQGGYKEAINQGLLPTQVALKGIDSMKLEFLFKGAQGYERKPTAHELIPSVVDVEIDYKDAYKRPQSIRRMLPVPVGI